LVAVFFAQLGANFSNNFAVAKTREDGSIVEKFVIRPRKIHAQKNRSTARLEDIKTSNCSTEHAAHSLQYLCTQRPINVIGLNEEKLI